MMLQFLINIYKIDTYYYQRHKLNKNEKISFFIKTFKNNLKKKIKLIKTYFFILIKILSLSKNF